MGFVVNGITIKNPSTWKVERYNVTNMERLSNGDMTGDLIAKKRKFYFTYEAITGAELADILRAIWSDSIFFTLSYPEGAEQLSATVYVGSIPSEAHYMSTRNVTWKNVQFNLIER